jgi:hypothetical protein
MLLEIIDGLSLAGSVCGKRPSNHIEEETRTDA